MRRLNGKEIELVKGEKLHILAVCGGQLNDKYKQERE